MKRELEKRTKEGPISLVHVNWLWPGTLLNGSLINAHCLLNDQFSYNWSEYIARFYNIEYCKTECTWRLFPSNQIKSGTHFQEINFHPTLCLKKREEIDHRCTEKNRILLFLFLDYRFIAIPTSNIKEFL